MKLFIFFLAAFALLSGGAQAAGVFPDTASFFENGQKLYEIKVFLNTEGKSVNALEGEMSFSEQDMNFEKIADGGSVVNFWIKNPQQSPEGKIAFSGGMPGGYRGEKGFLFSAVFSLKKALPENRTKISFQNLRLYLNDGRGTEEKQADFESIVKLDDAAVTVAEADTKPPEVFAPYVTRDPNLADGRWVVILNAQDKGEGIDRYEIFESAEKYKSEEIINNSALPWQPVENPKIYVLFDQGLESYIYAKAVDRAGNERTAIVIPAVAEKAPLFNFRAASVIIILSTAALVVFLEIFFFRRRKYG